MKESDALLDLIRKLSPEKRATLAELLRPGPDPIAVIGMACRFPGDVNTLDKYWELLKNGQTGIVEIPADRWDIDAYYDPDPDAPGKMYTRQGGFLPEAFLFDAGFFGLSPRESLRLDPQHRLLLEVAWEAMENAGQAVDQLAASAAGVFVGIMDNRYTQRQLVNEAESVNDPHFVIGSACNAAAGRLSYLFDFRGPSIAVDTACSSSLVAIHLACQSLRNKECSLAIAGGTHVVTTPDTLVNYCKMRMLSADGQCKTLDARADGFCLGEGCGLVVLKRLKDALANNDNVMAVIRGSAINEDGRSNGLTAPNGLAQQALIRKVLADIQIEPQSISYVEMHGSATPLGDPIEVESLYQVLAQDRSPEQALYISSVKTNLGHLATAAGVAGLIKTILSLGNRFIPPHLHLQQLNPNINVDWGRGHLRVPTELTPWQPIEGRRLAGVSSFGWAGTNAHVIVEEAEAQPSDKAARAWQLLLLSARSSEALDKSTTNLAEYLEKHPDINLADAAYTLQIGRKAFEHRRILVSQGRDDAIRILRGDISLLPCSSNPAQKRPVAFMFAGVGNHYVHMARELYELEPVFRETVDYCCEFLQPILGLDLRAVLYPADADIRVSEPELNLRQMVRPYALKSESLLDRTSLAQPAVFVIEYALAQLLQKWSIIPDALIGYSLGEYVAACVARVLPLKDALTLVARRAQMIQTLPEGKMISVPLSEVQVQPFLNSFVSLAVINGPGACVLAGPVEAMTQLETHLAEEEIVYRTLETSHAFHSSMMSPIIDEFTALLEQFAFSPPIIPYLSNVTGTWVTDAQATDPAYWVQHLCQTVKFGQGLDELLGEPNRVLVEVGPGQSLSSFAKQHPCCAREQLALILPTLRYTYDARSDQVFLLETLGKLWLTGHSIDWASFYGQERRRRIPLPTYPFERQCYRIGPSLMTEAMPSHRSQLPGKRSDIADWFYEPTWEAQPLVNIKSHTTALWLLFEPHQGGGELIAEYLSQGGATVVRAQAGECFARLASNLFTVRPDVLADYEALFDECQRSLSMLPTRIVHAWSLDNGETERSDSTLFETTQRVGLYSLLCLAQALGKQRMADLVELTVLTNGVQPIGNRVIHPEQATLVGVCRVIPQEYQSIRCRIVDVLLPISSQGMDETLVQLREELLTPIADVAVAYWDGKRYVQRFRSRRILDHASGSRLRPKGIYLITGGLGNIGLALADYLAGHWQARLILTSRSGLPPRAEWSSWLERHHAGDNTSARIRQIQALEALGAEVAVVSADVANEAHMQAVIDDIYRRFGRLDGVIHVAGMVSSDVFVGIKDMTSSVCEAHFASKVYGLYVLRKVLDGKEIDFCLLFSSISAILGGLGFAAYASANAFMDAYAHACNQAGESRWMSVNWDNWELAPGRAANILTGTATAAMYNMTPTEGVRAFVLALTSGSTHLVNSTGDLDARLRQWVKLEMPASTSGRTLIAHPRPILTTSFISAATDYEKRIAAIWQDALGIENIGIRDNFFDLGGNSMLGMQVIRQIQKAFGVQVPGVALFEAPTISQLAKYLQPVQEEEEDRETMALIERRRGARQTVHDQGIAIIGMNGRFPGAKNVDEFWQELCEGKEAISFFTDQELLQAGVDPQLLSQSNYIKARPALDDIELFDAAFFGYSPREASMMDPQHRLFLECAWEALELAGYSPRQYKGLIGVMAGVNISTYLLSWYTNPEMRAAVDLYQISIGNDKDSLSTTVSHKLNLRGPSFAVQTFCSTSLVAVHLACQSLLNGESDIALAGGVSIQVPTKQGYLYQEGRMESPDGHCRAFDAKAQGTMFGDGLGIVVLKRLAEALADGDNIYAVVKGSAINNDGSLKVGYTAPSVIGQAEAIRMALEGSDVHPDTIGYIEAHGTATELGDPIEVAALTRTFRYYTDKVGFCGLGSVKTNIGHLDRAAGVAGLIKTVLAIKHGLIPPSLHFEVPNPEIDLAHSPFYVVNRLLPWVRQNGVPRRAGINSLGLGGTNAHVIIEEPPVQAPSSASRPAQLLLISARTESALEMAAANLADHLRQHPEANLADVAYTLQVGRHPFEYRRMAVCGTAAEALQVLESQDPRRLVSHYQPDINRPVAMMFAGVGDHYLHMGRELYESEMVFRETIEQCSRVLQPYLGCSVRELLYPPEASPPTLEGQTGEALRGWLAASPVRTGAAQKLQETAVAQPVVFAVEYALARLLQSWGIQPKALVGYSLGEYVAACVAGVLSLEDGLRLVAERAQMIQGLPGGAMLAVSCTEEEVQPLLSDEVCLAGHLGVQACVLSGWPAAIEAVAGRLEAEGVAYRAVETTHAFHSSMMKPLVEPLTRLAQTVRLQAPRIPYVSNVTGEWIRAEEATDPAYWGRHLCQPVRFYEGLGELLGEKARVLVEVGPGQALGSFAKQHPRCEREQLAQIVSTLRAVHERQSDEAYLLGTLGKLWLLGVEPDWGGFYANETRHRIPLPTYPFQRQPYWIKPNIKPLGEPLTVNRSDGQTGNISDLPRQKIEDWFYLPSWKQMVLQLPPERIGQSAIAWLLFADQGGLDEPVREWLAEHNQTVITVQVGSSFNQISEGWYQVRPDQRDDYEALLKELKRRGLESVKVVHLWNVTNDECGSYDNNTWEQSLTTGFYSLMALAQAIKEVQLASCEISIVSTHMQAVTAQEHICPEKALCLGPCRVIPLEYNTITCRSIDIALPPANNGQIKTLVSNLMGELTSPATDSVVALRGHQRWIQTFEAIPLLSVQDGEPSNLRTNGVYLITGGLGGIGLAMAEYLARRLQARLILMARSELPPRDQWARILAEQGEVAGLGYKISRVQRLEKLGAEVMVIAADVSREAQVRSAVQQALARFGTIHGVIHAAGVPGAGLIQLKTPQISRCVLAPKLQGTLILERVLREQPLDFLVLFSSITSVTGGGPGQVDYCAANAFLDAYALNRSGERRLTTSIDWSEWQWNAWDAGLEGFHKEAQTYFRENRKRFGIYFEEGAEALQRILSRRLPHVVVCPQDFRTFAESTKSFTIERVMNWGHTLQEKQSQKYPRPVLGTSYVAPSNELEKKIAAAWESVLGIVEIGLNDNFFDLGGNSLIGLELVAHLRKTLEQETIPMHVLYEAPTVGALAKFVLQDQTEEIATIEDRLARGQERRQRLQQRRRDTLSRR